MIRETLTLSAIIVVYLATSTSSSAQTPRSENRQSPSITGTLRTGAPKSDDASGLEQMRRTAATSILTSLVSDSEHYEDQALRVRIVARSADGLWNVDQPMARGLFLQAWTIAEKVDGASQQTAEEAKKNALNSRGGMTMIPSVANTRLEVLGLAARRDPALGNLLVAKLEEAQKHETDSSELQPTSSRYSDPTQPTMAISKRLEVALQLLNAGDVKQATAFAEPALTFATSPGIIFLCTLRQRDSSVADNLYLRLLGKAASDPEADATAVSLLSSYILTPGYLVTATIRGRVSNQFNDTKQDFNASPILRSRFFSVAAAILLRPLTAADQDRTVAGRAGTYFTIARLLPMFQAYAPNYVSALNAQLALLASDAPDTLRNGQDPMLRLGLANDSPDDTIADILDKISKAANSTERDTLYLKAIRESFARGDIRLREFAANIDDETLRQRARSFVDLALVRSLLGKRDLESAFRIARDGYLVPLHQVWATTEIARALEQKDPDRAAQLLDDANVSAHRIEMGEASRVYALSCVASALFAFDRNRSWGLASEVVKAANSIRGFAGDNGKLSAQLRARNIVSMINVDEPSFEIGALFAMLAKDDLQLAFSTASSLTGEHARANATLAVARSVLEKQANTVYAKN